MASRYKGNFLLTDKQNQLGLFETPKQPEPVGMETTPPSASLATCSEKNSAEASKPGPQCPRCGARANKSLREPDKFYCMGFPACMEGDDIFRFTL